MLIPLALSLLLPVAASAGTAVTDLRVIEAPFERIDSPALSPSGDRVVFSAPTADGGMNLFVMPAAGGAPTRITAGGANDVSPVFSPDGARIAFVSNRSGNRDIWIVPAGGGEPTRVTDDPGDDIDPAWSPDGTRLAFASSRGGPLLLYQVTLNDRQAYMITAGTGADRRPAWSPDGSLLAFESTRDGKRQVWLVPPEGGEPRRAAPQEMNREESFPTWMPDTGMLMIHAGPPRAPGRLWLVPAGPERAVPVQFILPPLPGAEPGSDAPRPALSRDGRHMVFVGGGAASIEMIPVTGGVPKTVVSSEGRLRHPSWSPEGRRVVLAGDFGGSWDLWTAGVSSGRLTRLTSDDLREESPVWSKTTGDILYATSDGAETAIQMLEPESGRTIRFSRPVSEGAQTDTDPAWSPDGRSVAFVSAREGSRDLYVGPAGGGTPLRLTALPGAETHPTWSPDGTWIAFASDQGKGSEIWKIPAQGGEPVRLTRLVEGSPGDTLPAWSPAGTWIAFTRSLAQPDGGSDLYIIPPDGGRPFPLRRGSAGARIDEPAWSPDGRHLAYSYSLPDRLVILDLGEPPSGSEAPAAGSGPGTPEGLKRLLEQQREQEKQRLEQEQRDTAGSGTGEIEPPPPAEDPNGR